MARLSVQSARELQPGGVIHDHVVSGLQLRCRATKRTWHYWYRAADGKERRPKIGEFPTLSIEAARDAAKEWARQVATGADPSRDRRELRTAPTVAELAEKWLAADPLPWKTAKRAPRYAEECRRHAALIARELGGRKVAEVDQPTAAAFLRRVAEETGGPNANRIRAALSGMFRLAEHDELKWRPKGSNPAADTPKQREFKRRVHVGREHFAPVLAELRKLAPVYPRRVAALLCILYAGTRVTELITVRRRQYDGRVIRLEEHKTAHATGDDRIIVLPQQAREIIDGLADDGSGRLFGRMTRYDVHDTWDRARDAAGCPEVTVRDFRRTFASVAKSAGYGLEVIGELFSHTNTQTTERYAWLFNETKEGAAQAIADEIDRIAGSGK